MSHGAQQTNSLKAGASWQSRQQRCFEDLGARAPPQAALPTSSRCCVVRLPPLLPPPEEDEVVEEEGGPLPRVGSYSSLLSSPLALPSLPSLLLLLPSLLLTSLLLLLGLLLGPVAVPPPLALLARPRPRPRTGACREALPTPLPPCLLLLPFCPERLLAWVRRSGVADLTPGLPTFLPELPFSAAPAISSSSDDESEAEEDSAPLLLALSPISSAVKTAQGWPLKGAVRQMRGQPAPGMPTAGLQSRECFVRTHRTGLPFTERPTERQRCLYVLQL